MPFLKLHKIAIVIALAGISRAWGADPATAPSAQPNDPQFEKVLESINARALVIQGLSADFIQEKKSPLLRKPLVSRGTVTAKGAASLWKTEVPEKTEMTSDPTMLRIYYPYRKIVEEYPISGKLGMLAASPLPSLAALRENFTLVPDKGDGLVSNDPSIHAVPVRLNPSSPQMTQYVNYVRVLLDADHGLVMIFELVDPDNEQTVIRFTNVHTGITITDQDVKLNLPESVKVVRPMGAGENSGR